VVLSDRSPVPVVKVTTVEAKVVKAAVLHSVEAVDVAVHAAKNALLLWSTVRK
jgi:hypothetical protein